IDAREEQVTQAEQAQTAHEQSAVSDQPSVVKKAISHTFVTKRLVNLFIENMSAKDKEESEK
ncbi:MAG: hypothetical protein J5884_05095, partial [Paludibacteraceae bacterium]|nr:hypothetical protein [Paludibacteraceae bacterium]